MGKNRDRLTIVAAILEAANSGAGKTRIMRMSNLSYALVEKYLGFVLDSGFVHANGSRYVLTNRGRLFLDEFKQFRLRYVRAKNTLEELGEEQKRLERMCRKPRATAAFKIISEME